jgi:hypothetical protein
VPAKGSFVKVELKEEVADMSVELGIDATSICDCDIGVSEDSDSLSAVKNRSCCEAVGVRSGSGVDALFGLKSGITSSCGGSLWART